MNMRTPRPLLQDDDEDIMEMPPQEVDFSEYMWMMEEMEEFDQQVNAELQEQEMMEQCFEDLYEMEQLASDIISTSPVQSALITFDLPTQLEGHRSSGMVNARQEQCSRTISSVGFEECKSSVSGDKTSIILVATSSQLNPLAPEFKPRGEC